MLYLMRKLNQSVIVNNTIEVKIVEVKGKNVRLGFEFPSDCSILRKEIHDKIIEENVMALKSIDRLATMRTNQNNLEAIPA